MTTTKKFTKNTNIILWEGNSPIDGEKIVAILQTRKTSNTKIGDMLQVWIIRPDMHPSEAIKTGNDYSICGNCPLRGDGTGKGRVCYVNQMPIGAIWKSYRDGKCIHWQDVPKDKFKALCILSGGIRWGAYGDPALIPYHIFLEVSSYSNTNLGYTHQYDWDFSEVYKNHFQASAHSLDHAKKLQASGWHTYTIVPENFEGDGAICQGGKKTTCERCKLCNGKNNILEIVHGIGKKNFKAS